MEQLTRAEEQVMQVLWKLGKGFAKDVLAELPKTQAYHHHGEYRHPHPGAERFRGPHFFWEEPSIPPLVKKEAYSKRQVNKVVKDYFDGSLHGLVSSFVEKNELDVEELDEIMDLLKAHKKRRSWKRSFFC